MMTRQEDFRKLRGILAEIYVDVTSARRIVNDAGIDAAQIDFSNAAIDIWDRILREAEKTGKIHSLFQVVLSHYGDNQELRAACDAYQRHNAAPNRALDQKPCLPPRKWSDSIIGRAHTVRRRVERNGDIQVLSFRVKNYDEGGRQLPDLHVEMRGYTINGELDEDDCVEVRPEPRFFGSWRRKVYNHDTRKLIWTTYVGASR
jgi:hypothetical protein